MASQPPNKRGRPRKLESRQRESPRPSTPTPSLSPPTPSLSEVGTDDDDTLSYPPGCKALSPKMPTDVLICRLRKLSREFQSFDQNKESENEQYIPLCMYLADEDFLNHSSRDVRILIGCCIADILRIYAPEAPYKEPVQLKMIFKFLMTELTGLKNIMDPAFTRYFYLLETLSYVKAFNLCFDLEEGNELMRKLFKVIFDSVNEANFPRVKTHMVELLHPLITENDQISKVLINTLLVHVLLPLRNKKQTYELTKCVIIRCSDVLEAHIHILLQEALMYGANTIEWEECPEITEKIYELIYEIYQFCPSLVTSTLPQLEDKLVVSDENDRSACVTLLAKMFSEKGSTLAADFPSLWKCYLTRFNDASPSIRTKCVQHAMHVIIHHAPLRQDIVDALQLRQHDPEVAVRWEVVKTILAVAKKDVTLLSENALLLDFIKERSLDKKFQVRRDALHGLALVYKTRLELKKVPQGMATAAGWIMNRILHGYYVCEVEDKIIVEKLVNTSLVPFHLESNERMMALLYLYSSMDAEASKAFAEVLKNLFVIRRHLTEFIHAIREKYTEPEKAAFNLKLSILTKHHPDVVPASEFLYKFTGQWKEDEDLKRLMERILDPNTNCKNCGEYINLTLKKLGAPVMTNLYYKIIKVYLERAASLLIDKEAITELISIVQKMMEGTLKFDSTYPVDTYVVIDKAFELLAHLAGVFPNHFDDEQILINLFNLAMDENASDEHVYSIILTFTSFAKIKPIGIHYPGLMELLIPFCNNLMTVGTPRQGKIGARCLHANVEESRRKQVFTSVVERLENLDSTNAHYRTAIVTSGHIGLLMPTEFKTELRKFVTQKIVKELLVWNNQHGDLVESDSNWCEQDKLSENTRNMMAGMKATVHWLIGLKTDTRFAPKTFKMLAAYVETGGDLRQEGIALNDAEKAWLRLTAGCCMLKLCEQKGVGDEFSAMQFCSLSKLMIDSVSEVKTRFLKRLHKGLSQGIPQKCLPLDFMGLFALGGYETDKKKRNEISASMKKNIKLRRDYIKLLTTHGTNEQVAKQMQHLMPEYMIAFAVPVLAHSPNFTCHTDIIQLKSILDCLGFIMEPLVKNEHFSFAFYKGILEKIKGHQSAVDEETDATFRMHAICDIALGLLMDKSEGFHMLQCETEPKVSPMYFKRLDPTWDSSGYKVPEIRADGSKRWGVRKVEPAQTSQNKVGKRRYMKRKKQGSKGGTEESQGTQEAYEPIDIDDQPSDRKMSRLDSSQSQMQEESEDED